MSDYQILIAPIRWFLMSRSQRRASRCIGCCLALLVIAGPLVQKANAQTAFVDSLKQRLPEVAGTERVRLLYTLADYVRDAESAIQYGQDALALADSLAYERGQAYAALILAWRYARSGREYEASVDLLKGTLPYFEDTGDRYRVGLVWRRIGNLLLNLDQHEEALAAYRTAIVVFEEASNTSHLIRTHLQMGRAYYLQSAYAPSVESYTAAKTLADSLGSPELHAQALMGLVRVATRQVQLGEAFQYALALEALVLTDSSLYSQVYNSLGIVYEGYEQYEKALFYYERSLAEAEVRGYKLRKEMALQNIGLINRYLKRYDASEAAYQEALRIKGMPGPYIDYEPLWRDMGLLYEELGQLDEAMRYFTLAHEGFVRLGRTRGIASGSIYKGRIHFKQGRYAEAITLIEEGLVLAEPLQTLDLLRDGYETLHRSHAALGQFQQAYALKDRFHAYSDSVFNGEKLRDQGRLEAEFAFEQQQGLLAAEQEQQAQQNQWRSRMLTVVYVLLLLALAGGGLYARQLGSKNKKIEVQKSQLELQAFKLRELDELKSRFFANISHELRTPLTLIQGHMEDVRNTRYGGVSDAAKQHLDFSLEQTKRLGRLVQQLLDLARLQSSRLALQATPFDLTDFLRRQVAIFDSLAAKYGVVLHFRGPSEAVPIYGDTNKLENVFVNLIGNALKFTEAGGQVEVGMSVPATEERSTGQFAVIEVRDTGIGIPEDDLARIFDRFYQVDNSATRKYEGTGVGLALVKELVTLHGGDVEVASTIGEGTTFTVRLPLGTAHLDASEIVSASNDALVTDTYEGDGARVDLVGLESEGVSQAQKERRILVVEDNTDVRAYLVSHLRTQFTVVEAGNGKEALARLQETEVDLVISDVMMPEMDGLGLLQRLKADPQWQALPVLLLTARAGDDERLRALEARADDYLTKPFRVDELLARSRNLIDFRKAVAETYATKVLTIDATTIAEESEEAAFLSQLQQKIETHLADPQFDVEELAEAVHMSKPTLQRKLKGVTGETPAACIRRFRLEQAKQHLENGTFQTVQEVAVAVGFKDASYFSRLFRKTYGMSPASLAMQKNDLA